MNKSLENKLNIINCNIEKNQIRQIRLLDAQKFSKLLSDNHIGIIKKKYIFQLWQTGLLKADVVKIEKKTKIKGMKYITQSNNYFLYHDQRVIKLRETGYGDSFVNLKEPSIKMEPFFHPFRSYVVYRLVRALNPHIFKIQTLLFTKGYNELILSHIEFFKKWSSNKNTIELIEGWNSISLLCAIIESITHIYIFNKITF